MQQRTVKHTYVFEGKGLHTGVVSRLAISPAPEDSGIVFRRSDLEGVPGVPALAEYVSTTTRSTTISNGSFEINTVEHVLSALTGLGVDNAVVEVSNVEVPILDGSARPYVEAILADGLAQQSAPRRYITVPKVVEVSDPESGSWVRIEPADTLSYDVTVDFGSRVLGVQTAHWDESVDYSKEIAVCRTFVFFHEIEFLLAHNLIKGGDVDNAIVIVEHPVSEEQVSRIAQAIGRPTLHVEPNGYLSNIKLNFPNECGRHKLLDLIGDIRLAGGYLKARITAFKPGHTMNTKAAKELRAALAK